MNPMNAQVRVPLIGQQTQAAQQAAINTALARANLAAALAGPLLSFAVQAGLSAAQQEHDPFGVKPDGPREVPINIGEVAKTAVQTADAILSAVGLVSQPPVNGG
jgi:hypothetical protein